MFIIQIPQPEISDDQDSDLESCSARRPDFASASPSPKMKPSRQAKKVKDKNLTEVLVNLVSESKQELKYSQAALAQVSTSRNVYRSATSLRFI